MVTHRGNAGDGPFAVLPSDPELRGQGFTEDDLDKLHGRRELTEDEKGEARGRLEEARARARGELPLRGLREEVAHRAAELAASADEDAREVRRGEAERFAANMALPKLSEPLSHDERAELDILRGARSVRGWSVVAVGFACFSAGFALANLLHVHFGAP